MEVKCSCCNDSFELVVNVFALYNYDSDTMNVFDIIVDEYENRKKRKQIQKMVRDKIPFNGDCLIIAEVYPNDDDQWKINLKTLALDYREAGNNKIMQEKYGPRFPRHLDKICSDIVDFIESKCSEEETTH